MAKEGERQEFYAALGRAIAQWQHVEFDLFRVYLALLGTTNIGATSAAFHSITSPQARLAMTHAAAKVILDGSPLLDRWPPLRKRIKSTVERRNDLAHLMVVHEVDSTGESTPVLRASILDLRPNLRRYQVHQIEELRGDFAKLSQDISDFVDEAVKWQLKSKR